MVDVLYIVLPCYCEEAVLPITAEKLRQKLADLCRRGAVAEGSRILFVDDGSTDRTWEIIRELHEADPVFSGIRLTRNRGHQNALLAGLMSARAHADVTVSMDADLQDDIDAIDDMLARYAEGCDIVYGVRSQRDTDTYFKRTTAEGFYRLMGVLGASVVFNHADYRLMSRRALDALSEFREVNLFLRGIIPMVGFRSASVPYRRGERAAGESKYPLRRMIAFALEGITSLSVRPIRLITGLGVAVFLVSLGMLLYFLVRYFTGNTVTGWASLAVSMWAIGGLQLLAIGVIGEYIGKVYLETKARPRYLIEEVLSEDPPTRPDR